MNHAILIAVLCIVSAILGRLLLTREQAWKTVKVRLPALLAALALVAFGLVFWLIYGVVCFVGGAFYGLATWWWPQLCESLGNGFFEVFEPVLSGSWE